MADEDRHPYAGRMQLDGRIENLLGLDHHLPFFLGCAVLQEDIYMRDDIEGDLFGEFLPLDRRVHVNRPGLVEQLIHRLAACAGDRLIGGDDNAADAGQIMEGLQRHHHLHGRAIGIGDDVALGVAGEGFRIHFGHHQRYIGVHPELRGVVDDDGARCRGLRCVHRRNLGSRR